MTELMVNFQLFLRDEKIDLTMHDCMFIFCFFELSPVIKLALSERFRGQVLNE